jgi:hypothetical protein
MSWERLVADFRCMAAKRPRRMLTFREQHLLTRAYTSGDGLADRAGSHRNNNIGHGRTITFSASRAFIA